MEMSACHNIQSLATFAALVIVIGLLSFWWKQKSRSLAFVLQTQVKTQGQKVRFQQNALALCNTNNEFLSFNLMDCIAVR